MTSSNLYSVLQSAVRNATQTILGKDLIDAANVGINPQITGITVYLYVTSVPGIDTIQLVFEEQDPASKRWAEVASTSPTTVAGMIRLKIYPGIEAIPASLSQVAASAAFPGTGRLRIVHSGASNWTYSLGVVLYN